MWKSSYYPIVYKKGIYRLPYFVGKARTTQLGFCPQSIGASKDREESIGWERMQQRPRVQDQHGVHRISHSGSCNGTVQWLRAQRVCVWNGDKGTAAALPLQRHFNADEVATPACPCVVYIYSSLWSAGATPRLKTSELIVPCARMIRTR